ncbi:MAG: glucose 1-dehydrogenase, partial [Pseudomonadota bacterium]
MRLNSKTAIVTGGASGFGAGIVDTFIAEGARVVIGDINQGAAEEKAEALGQNAYAVPVDVADGDSVAGFVRAAQAVLGTVDIVVNNAGIGHVPQPMEEVEEDLFTRLIEVNTKSIYLMAKHLVPAMKQAGGGAILNMASTAGVSPRPNLTWYNATKGWVITATKSMAVELAPHGIRVNALNPVAGETPLLATFMGEDTPDVR